MRRLALISIFLLVITLAAYWPVHQAGYTNYDDDAYVTENPPVLHGLTIDGFRWAFTTFHASNWHPLTWLSLMADCSLFGENAAAEHLVNLGLHLANTLLVFLLLWRMTGAVWRSGCVAALFALHPLHVESVAWIAERKDVLSTFFGLLTLLLYVRYAELSKVQPAATAKLRRKSPRFKIWYWLALISFALGLLSKPMLVTFPFVMLLLDFWPLSRCQPSPGQARWAQWRRLTVEKLPFFALAFTASVITYRAQETAGAVLSLHEVPLLDRLANVAVAYVMYLAKTFWPIRLAVLYPFVSDLPAMQVVLAVTALLGATTLAFVLASRAPYVFMGWLWFVGTLVPVIGLVQVGNQALADRYTYVPLIGVFVIVTWGAVDLTTRWRWQRLALPLLAAVILTGCFACTRAQVGYWRNSLTLFAHTLDVTKDNPVAEQAFGFALALSGNEREAVRHFDAALRVWPEYLPALLNRCIALMLAGRVEEAVTGYREVIRIRPNSAKAYYQLAGAVAQQKKLAEAGTNYLLALRYQPDFPEAHTKLGKLLLLQGDPSGGMQHLYEAVRIRPDYPEGQYALGNELAQQQKFSEAVIHLRAAIKAQPNYIEALNDLAWILATQDDPAIRNVPEAIRLTNHACELTRHKQPSLLDTLGVALSEAGQFSEALRVTNEGLSLAVAAGDERMAAELRQHLELYRKGLPYQSNPR